MASRRTAQLDAGLIARKGEAKPTAMPSAASARRETVAVTVRLDPERYRRLVSFGAKFAPRRKNQDILVAALDAYLDKEDA